jgi:adenylosuccinate lyase
MRELFSDRTRILLWRRLWLALAQAERELGLPVPAEPLTVLQQRMEEIDFSRAAELEKRLRHDVMAHLHTFAELQPEARPWLHLGATSCFITDNADLMVLREGLGMVRDGLVAVLEPLADFARAHKDLPVLGYTHFQPAQPTTLGKRVCLWLQDLLLDLDEITRVVEWLPFRGVKGTTGTQASFLALFQGDHQKVEELDRRVAEKMGFQTVFRITGQTYPRKVDSKIAGLLAGVGQSAAKAGADLRLLAHERELEEPYESHQIGSSAMAYKRNPMRAERMCSLARYLIHLPANTAETASQQWLERTLDDSANRRLVLAEAHLASDAILRIYHSIAKGLVVNEAVIEANLRREAPFLCTEEILMLATTAGGDRQLLHEQIRVHSRAAVERLKAGATDNDLLQRLASDPAFDAVKDRLDEVTQGKRLIGRAPQQVVAFLEQEVEPAVQRAQQQSSGGRTLEDLDV